MDVIKVKSVSKSFKVYHDKGYTLKERILFMKRNHYESRNVLNQIDLLINKGDVVGLIGENGSGKSTLLKLLTRIIYPDNGKIEVFGKVSSLLELGAGFHPDLSGKENIYTNASIFGLTKKEIDDRFDKIVSFSELEEFIDNPVRTYSSGMYMRLAFSVAINVDADILLIDEILAVGDLNFQAKCFNRLRELKARGVTIVLVTHDLSTIEKFCTKAVWLNEGKIVIESTATQVVDAYLRYLNDKRLIGSVNEKNINSATDKCNEETKCEEIEKTDNVGIDVDTSQIRFGLGHIEITRAIMLNTRGLSTTVFKSDETLEIVMDYKVNKELREYVFGIGIFDLDGNCLLGCNTQLDRIEMKNIKSVGKVSVRFRKLSLLSGRYVLQVAVVDENGIPMDFHREYLQFDVISEDRAVGYISMNRDWTVI